MKTIITILLVLVPYLAYAGCDAVDNDFDDKPSFKITESGCTITSTGAGNLDSIGVKLFWDFYEAPGDTTYYAGVAIYLRSDSSFVDSTEHLGFINWSTDSNWVWFDCIENASISASTEYIVMVKADSVLPQHGFDLHRDTDGGESWYYHLVTSQMRTWPSKYDPDGVIATYEAHIKICYSTAGGATKYWKILK